MKSRPKKKEIVVFYIYYRGRGRAVGDGARTRVREKGKSMGNVGRGGERRYLGVCSDGFRRRWVDREDDGGYAEKKGRKKVEKMRRGSERSGWGCDRRCEKKVEKMRRGSE